jgi:hypothetical protein
MHKLLRELNRDDVKKPKSYALIGKKGKFIPSTETKCAERNALFLFLQEEFSFQNTYGFHIKKKIPVPVIVIRARTGPDGEIKLSMSHPCTNCRAYLRLVERKFHISFKITYSTSDGGFETKTTDALEYYERPKEKRTRRRNKKKL